MDEYLAIIKMFAGNFAPRGFMFCQGQVLNISTNTALFSLLGTTYGGNGQTTFALPDLQGRVAIGAGVGAGLPPYQLGQMGGSPSTVLTQAQMPAHTHGAVAAITMPAVADDGDTNIPGPTVIMASAPSSSNIYSSSPPDTNLKPFPANVNVQVAGGSQPVATMPPYLTVNYIICVNGLFPSRN